MPTIYVETPREFTAKHGEPLEQIRRTGDRRAQTGRYLYPDGASMVNNGYAQIYHEPPVERFELLRAKREYALEQLARAEEDFNGFKQFLLDTASLADRYGNRQPPSPARVEELRVLKVHYENAAHDLEVYEEDLYNDPRAVRARELAESRQRLESHARQAANDIRQIRL